MSTRREFIRQAALAGAGLSMGSIFPSFTAKGASSVAGANEKIRVGVIGVNSRGLALAQGFAKMPGCEVTYICDCDTQAMDRCCAAVERIQGSRPKGIQDIRKMVEEDFDAAVIATPDHWHAKAAIMAMQAGKHVYLEKPTSYCPSENELLVKAVAKYGKVAQAGNQRRSWPNIIQAIQELRDGTIGKVQYAKSWYTNNRPSIGQGKPIAVPAHLDWDLWQGPAPRVPEFHDNYIHYNWHWFLRWGTGEALNNGTHFVDLLRWGLDVDYPTLVSSVGGRFRYKDDWEFPDTQMISFQFGDDAACTWEGRSCNSTPVDGKGLGVAFYGETGALYLTGGNDYTITDMAGNVVKKVDSPAELAFEQGNLINPAERLDMIHFQNWFDGIRKGAKLNSDIVEACVSTQLVQLGNISQLVGHALNIDPASGRIIGDKEAKKLWTREYEKGWEIKL